LVITAGAVQTLLISDNLFRINDVKKRQRYVGELLAPYQLPQWLPAAVHNS
jgi:stalled ribosome rescue protein Dom34